MFPDPSISFPPLSMRIVNMEKNNCLNLVPRSHSVTGNVHISSDRVRSGYDIIIVYVGSNCNACLIKERLCFLCKRKGSIS